MRRADVPDEPATRTGAALPRADAALGALLLRLQPRMTAVAIRFVRDRDAAADVVQNAYEKVCRHRDRFRGEARVSTWVHRIVANEALMWLRSETRRGRGRASEEGEHAVVLPDSTPSVEARLLEHERASRLRLALASLAPEEREVLDRCALGDVSYRHFGREQGLHPAAVKSRAFRARRRLAEVLHSA